MDSASCVEFTNLRGDTTNIGTIFTSDDEINDHPYISPAPTMQQGREKRGIREKPINKNAVKKEGHSIEIYTNIVETNNSIISKPH